MKHVAFLATRAAPENFDKTGFSAGEKVQSGTETLDFTGRSNNMSKNYGLANCSLGEGRGQDLNRQVRELKMACAEEIITERVHGDAKAKPRLDFLLEHIEPNSSLYVTDVSRLSHSTQQLCEALNTILEKHLRLVILNSMTIDCRKGEMDAMSAAFLQIPGDRRVRAHDRLHVCLHLLSHY